MSSSRQANVVLKKLGLKILSEKNFGAKTKSFFFGDFGFFFDNPVRFYVTTFLFPVSCLKICKYLQRT